MSSHLKEPISDNVGKKAITKQQPETAHVALPAPTFKRASGAQDSLSHTEILQLQRTIGNRRVSRLLSNIPSIQPKPTVGPVGDKYEQEADQVAENVVKQSNSPSPQPAQRQEPEEEELLQGRFETAQRQAAEDEDLLQGRFAGSKPPKQRQGGEDTVENRTGMPDPLKAGLEQLSGIDLSGVRVHRNSAKPSQLNALAYTQGQDIELGPGQEKHLPHEGWHAVQQMQERVKPTMQAQGVSINDNEGLEHEADVMGAKALMGKIGGERTGPSSSRSVGSVSRISPSPTILQGQLFEEWTESEVALRPKKKAKSKLWSSYEDAFGPSPVATPVDATFGTTATLAGLPTGYEYDPGQQIESTLTAEPSLGMEDPTTVLPPAAGWDITGLVLSASTLAGTIATIVMGGRKYHQAGKDLIDPELDVAAKELAKREHSEGWLQVVKGVFALGKLLAEDLASILKLIKDSGSAVASSIAAGIGVVWNGIQAVLLSRRAFKAGKRRRRLWKLGMFQAGSDSPVFQKVVKYAHDRSQRREIRAAAAATGTVFGVAAGAVGIAIAAGAAAIGLTPAGWALAAAAAAFGLAFLGYKIGKKIYKYVHRKQKAEELVEELLGKDKSKRQDAEEYLLQLLGLIPAWVRTQANRTGGKEAMILLVRERLSKKRDFIAEGVWAALTGPEGAEQDEARRVVEAMGLKHRKVAAGGAGKELIKKKLPSWF